MRIVGSIEMNKIIFFLIAVLSAVNGIAQDKSHAEETNTSIAGSQPELMNVFVAPEKELIVVQWKNLNTENRDVILVDSLGKTIQKTTLYQGSTIAYFDTQTLYSGNYEIRIPDGNIFLSRKLILHK